MSLRQLLSPILRRFGVSSSTSNGHRIVRRDIQSNTTNNLKATYQQVNRSQSFDDIRTEELDIKSVSNDTNSKAIPKSLEHTSAQVPTSFSVFSTERRNNLEESTRNFEKSSKSYENVRQAECNIHITNPLTVKNGNSSPTTTNNNTIKESKSNNELLVMTTAEQFNKTSITNNCDDFQASKGHVQTDFTNDTNRTKSMLSTMNESTNYPEVVCSNPSTANENSNETHNLSKKKEFEERGDSPRRTLQHRHTYNSFTTQESLSKDEARRRMLSWRKTTKMRKSTTPTTSPQMNTTSANNANEAVNVTSKKSYGFSASRKRGVFIGNKKSQSMVQ